jgi:hypothetical protein
VAETPSRPLDIPPEIDTQVPHAARVYDYMINGTTNFEADRQASHAAAGFMPGGFEAARAGLLANRAFLLRSVRYLTGEVGVRQFLDIGTGIPVSENVHDVAQAVASDTRIVYVDNDPIVLAHAHQLLRSTDEGTTRFVQGDLRRPDAVLAATGETLDLSRPVGLLLVSLLHFLTDAEDPYGVVQRYVDALPSGSYLVLTHLAQDVIDLDATYAQLNAVTDETFTLRPKAAVARFFDGLELVEPGLVIVDDWRPDADHVAYDGQALPLYGAVARKP